VLKSKGYLPPHTQGRNYLKFPSVRSRRRIGKPNGFWLVSSDCQRAGTPRPAGRDCRQTFILRVRQKKSSADSTRIGVLSEHRERRTSLRIRPGFASQANDVSRGICFHVAQTIPCPERSRGVSVRVVSRRGTACCARHESLARRRRFGNRARRRFSPCGPSVCPDAERERTT